MRDICVVFDLGGRLVCRHPQLGVCVFTEMISVIRVRNPLGVVDQELVLQAGIVGVNLRPIPKIGARYSGHGGTVRVP